MRMTKTELKAVTNLERPTAQARWFRHHFGITLPCDKFGPVITPEAYAELIRRQCGLSATTGPIRPKVKLNK